MNLKQARIIFSYLFCEKLVEKVKELSESYALDEVTNHQGTGHEPGSLHYSGCAGDLILYDKNGNYVTGEDIYPKLGVYWKSLPDDPDSKAKFGDISGMCKWGGDFKTKDFNHFSFAPQELFNGRA